jgi:dihydroorotate dehydrogenase electron transfer subunit
MPNNRETPLVRREPLEGAYVLLTYRHPEVAHQARAGQFVMIKAGLSAEPPLRRPFSVLSVDPAEDTFTLFLKAVGAGTRALAAMAPGDLAQCLGPLGRPFEAPRDGRAPLLVAGGYGIAPFLLFCDELRRAGHEPRVFYGGRGAADLQLRAPFDARGVALVPATEDGSLGRRGRVTEVLDAWLEHDTRPATLYGCGPDAMMHALARLGARRGLPVQVSLDPWMGCGVGTCLGCVVWIQRAGEPRPKYRCACTEGPVFDADVVVWPGEATSRAASGAVA